MLIVSNFQGETMKFLDSNGQVIETQDRPRFVVLTGLNGSGKSMGLKSLSAVEPLSSYIDYFNFQANWTSDTLGQEDPDYLNLSFPQLLDLIRNDSAERNSTMSVGVFPPSWDTIQNLALSFYNQAEQEKRRWFANEGKTTRLGKLANWFFDSFPTAQSIGFEKHGEILHLEEKKQKEYFNGLGEDDIGQTLRSLAKRKSIPAHCITQEIYASEVAYLKRKRSPLNLNLQKLFHEYIEKRNSILWDAYKKNTSRDEAINKFNLSNVAPWDILNKELDEIRKLCPGILNFKLNSPDLELPNYKDLKQVAEPIELKLAELDGTKLRDIREVSSGERAMLGLVTLTLTHRNGHQPPALFLDEIDASFHPSMILSMLSILEKQALDFPIVFATHSPSTVALAPEESLFLMKNGSAQRVSRQEALEGLTEGFFTTETITTVFRGICETKKRIVVLSEGKNYKYLDPIFEFLGINSQIYVFQWRNPGGRGCSELKSLMALFSEMLATNNTSDKRFVFLYDCDVNPKDCVLDTENVIGIYLSKTKFIENIVQRGIENIIPNEVLEPLGNEIYENSTKEKIRRSKKDFVCEQFLSKLTNNQIPIKSMQSAFKDLIGILKPQ